ncbi:MAG: FitA-like ribbon-helix-helix domain-containing protein, partial [Geminicoccaceae bacterium]
REKPAWGVNPANLTLHLDEHLFRRLVVRAAAHGRSVEAEHRAILEAALRSELTGRELWQKLASGAPVNVDFESGADQGTESIDFE